jgi:putative ABC transport system permease protein
VIGTFSVLAIFIACLGLFGLSSFTILQRTKEIGIRKVLGGSVLEIVRLLSKDFIKLTLLAGIISIPFAYFAMQEWLSAYVVRVPINIWIFLIPTFIIVFVSLLTIAVQTIRAAQVNPVNSLRAE